MSIHQIHVFISHSWAYSSHYETLASWISDKSWRVGQASLNLRDYSVPRGAPILGTNSDRALREALYRKIALSHVIIIPTGMYAHYSRWIQKEIDGAKIYSKPILAVDIRGALRRASIVVNAADKTVGWNSNSVVMGIWNLYYNRRLAA